MEKKSKSVHLDDDVHQELRIRTAKKGTYIQDEVNEILKKELELKNEKEEGDSIG